MLRKVLHNDLRKYASEKTKQKLQKKMRKSQKIMATFLNGVCGRLKLSREKKTTLQMSLGIVLVLGFRREGQD